MRSSFHNPDRYMNDLRQIISQGRKRIGILIGAGAPYGIRVNESNSIVENGGFPLIQNVEGLTKVVFETIGESNVVLKIIQEEIGEGSNIERLLTRIRLLSEVLNCNCMHGCNGDSYGEIATKICKIIGSQVNVSLPKNQNPYTTLVSWIGGVDRPHPIEIFTTNYDTLFEQALESVQLAYFDGFVGSNEPFFDPPSVANNDLPTRWVRLWKMHGSLGWSTNSEGSVVRMGGSSASELIYPEHLKYGKIQKLPYASLLERLKVFLMTPDTLLLACGFSFRDAHISSTIEESLSANPSASVFAFQFGNIKNEDAVVEIACRRPNLSVYSRDEAIIFGVPAPWKPGDLPSKEWRFIRSTYWKTMGESEDGHFVLGDFNYFAKFFTAAQTEQVKVEVSLPAFEVQGVSD